MTFTTATILDVRDLACQDRHAQIFATFAGLQDGQALELVNDHDPRPLRAHFDIRHPGGYDWTYLERGPETWRVQIGKGASAGGCCSGGACCG